MNEQYDYGYEVPPVQNQVAVPQPKEQQEGIAEKALKWINILFITNAFTYLLIVLLNIGVFITTMFYKPDVISYAVGFFFLSIFGAKVLIRHG
jgi:uncharacterized membrane protein YiaA